MTELAGFTAEQASRVTGLTLRQLSYWDKTGFFSPSVLGTGRRFYSRLYSFRNLVGLKTIALLRNKHRIPLQELRRVGAWLSEHHATPWATLSLYVAGRKVYFEDPRSGAVLEARPGTQRIMPIELVRVAADTQVEIDRLKERQPSDVGNIRRHRHIAHNEDVISGTRIPAAAIWNLHNAGYGVAQILSEYPALVEADVAAAIHFVSSQKQKAG